VPKNFDAKLPATTLPIASVKEGWQFFLEFRG